LPLSCDHYLRRVFTCEIHFSCIIALPLRNLPRRENISPTEVIPIVDVVCVWYHAPARRPDFAEQSVRWQKTRTPLRGEQLEDNGSAVSNNRRLGDRQRSAKDSQRERRDSGHRQYPANQTPSVPRHDLNLPFTPKSGSDASTIRSFPTASERLQLLATIGSTGRPAGDASLRIASASTFFWRNPSEGD
jgi:hypothetical protein